MRRMILACVLSLVASGAALANPYFLDRTGVLWTASAERGGLVLTGTRDGQPMVRSVVPFELGLAGANDAQIQVAADDLTGKVAVVWQRNWSPQASEIIAAVWNNGSWERVVHLTSDLGANPRNPVIQVTQSTVSVPDPSAPDDPTKATPLQDSFLHVLWWEGTDQQHASYALLQLTGSADDHEPVLVQDLDQFADIGLACNTPPPPGVLEHPLFAAQTSHDRALIFFGSERNCFFQLVEIHFILDPSTSTGGGMTASTQRRRQMPIFGLKKSFPMTQDVTMENAHLVLGANLVPVVYRVVGGTTIEYVTATGTDWTPRRTLTVANGLTLDQAIPLVENLAR